MFEPSRSHQKQSFLISTIGTVFFWNSSIPKFFQYFFEWCNNLQYLAILLWIQSESVNTNKMDSFCVSIYKVTKLLSFGDFLVSPADTLSTTLTLSTWVYFLFIFNVFGVILIRAHLKGQISKFENYATYFLSQFHLAFGFWVVSIASMRFANFESLEEDNFEIFAGININLPILKGICILVITANYIVTTILSILSYDPFKSNNLFSVHTPIFQIHTFIFKAITMAVISAGIDSTLVLWCFALFSLLWSTFRHYKLLNSFPYYHYLPMKYAILISSVALLISFLNFFSMILRSNGSVSYLDTIYIEILLLPFLLKVNSQYLQKIIRKNIKTKGKKGSSEEAIIRRLFAINYSIENPKLVMSITEIEKAAKENHLWVICAQFYSAKEAIIQNIHPKQGNVYQQLEFAYLKHVQSLFITILLDSIKDSKSKNNKLKIILADHLSTLHIISPLAITNLLSVNGQKGLLQVEATKILKNIEGNLQKYYQNGESTVFDIKTYVDCKKNFNHLLKLISRNTKRVLDFWEVYKSPEQKLLDLYLKSQVIEKEDVEIRQFWTKFVGNNRTFAISLSTLYSNYLLYIRNAPYSAHKVEKQARIFQHDRLHANDDMQIISRKTQNINKNIVVYVSMSKENLGKILDISPNTRELIGWRREDLLKNNISVLIPDFLKEKHSQLMLKHLENVNASSRLSKNIDIFTKAKQGHILPCYLYLCFYPYVQHDLVYVAIIKPKKYTNMDQIIVNEQGVIEGYTKGIENQIQDLLVKKTIEASSPFPNKKEINTTTKPLKSTETEISPMGIYISSFPDDQISPSVYPENNRKNLEASPKFKELKKKSSMVEQYFQNYNIEKSLYVIEDQKFTLLNLEKNNTEFVSDKLTSKNQKIKNKVTESKLIDDEDMKDENVPCERLDVDRGEDKKFKKTIINSNQVLSTRKSDPNFSVEKNPGISSIVTKTEAKEAELNSYKEGVLESLSSKDSDKASAELPKKIQPKILYSTFSSQNSSWENKSLGLEQAFYALPREPKIKSLNIFLSLLIIISSTLIAYFQEKNKETLGLLQGNIEILNNQTLRLVNLLKINQIMVNIILVDTDLYTLDRYGWAGIPDLRFIQQIQLALTIDNLNRQNTDIASSLYKIDDNLRYRLYEKIPVLEEQSVNNFTITRSANPFDLVSEIVAASGTINSRPFTAVRGNDSDVQFIYRNTLNDIYTSGERAIDVIIDDIAQKLNTDLRFILVFTFVMVATVLLLLLFLISIIREIIVDRDKILDIFLRLEEKSLHNYTTALAKFYGVLEQQSLDIHKLNAEIKKANFITPDTQMLKHYNYKKRSTKTEGINFRIKKIFIIMFFLFISVLSGYMTVLILVEKQNHEISRKVNSMVTTNSNIYNEWVIFSCMHKYVKDNTTSMLRGKPIKEEWETTFNKLTVTQEQFLTITDPDVGIGPNPTLVEIIEGNLCKIIASDPYAGAQCEGMVYGIIKKGLFRLNSFMMSLYKRVKLFFDSSSRTKEDMFSALNMKDLIESEAVIALFLLPAYEMVGALIKEQLDRDLTEFNQKIMKFIIMFIVIYVIFGGLLCYKLKQKLLDHKYSWRKLLRLVPGEMLATNKLLQTYLEHTKANTYEIK